MRAQTRDEMILDHIYMEVDARLNPSGEECWYCGGEGYTHDCIDGCCECADEGCEDCSRPCAECRIYASERAKAIREEVIRMNNVEVAIAWLKSIGRWNDNITENEVRENLAKANAVLSEATKPSRAWLDD